MFGHPKKVHQLTVRVEHGKGRGGIPGTPHRGQNPDLHVIAVAELVVVAHVRLPRRERDATPERLPARPANLRRRFALERRGGFARERGEQRRLGPRECILPKLVPGVRHLGDFLDEVRGFHLVGELADHVLGEGDFELDEPVAVSFQHGAKLGTVELTRGLTLQALDLRE